MEVILKNKLEQSFNREDILFKKRLGREVVKNMYLEK